MVVTFSKLVYGRPGDGREKNLLAGNNPVSMDRTWAGQELRRCQGPWDLANGLAVSLAPNAQAACGGWGDLGGDPALFWHFVFSPSPPHLDLIILDIWSGFFVLA